MTTLASSRPQKRWAPYIRTAPDGRIGFSVMAYRMLGEPEEVEILLNKDSGLLGFRPTTGRGTRRSWYVSTATKSGPTINCAKLLQMLSLRNSSMVFFARLQKGILVVDLQRSEVL